ncbi:MAG TPA: TRAP transporter substrate-binding protein DctP [Geomonas sp.]|nr:TRAP transporter substrate-binding protein DctP [Geomonas sp.]
MDRRSFLKHAGVGLAAGAFAFPSISRGEPVITWRMASSYPPDLATLNGIGEFLGQRVAELTGGQFQIEFFPAGEIVPAFGVLDAVRNGTVELGYTSSYYYYDRDVTFCFDAAIPFGMNNRQMDAWYREGNGGKLMGEFFAKWNIVAIPCGNTGTQMGGWFRKEIRNLHDLKGLKMRIAGLGADVMAKLGVLPQQLPAGDILAALKSGIIDAAEWVGPYDDLQLGLNTAAQFYYYPGWWEGGVQISAYANAGKWAELPAQYQAAFRSACADAHSELLARYDDLNPGALQQLLAYGTRLTPFPKQVMDEAYEAAQVLYSELSAKNPGFATIYADYKSFMDANNAWNRIADSAFARFMESRL